MASSSSTWSLIHMGDQAFFARCPAGEGRNAVEPIEIFGNGRAFGDQSPVRQFAAPAARGVVWVAMTWALALAS